MHPRYGRAPEHGRRYVARPGVYAVLPRGGQVLLTAEAAETREIQLPGGGIEAGESPIPALHREVFEETGWRIGPPRHLGVYRRFTFMPEYGIWAEKVCHIFVARPVLRLGPPTEAHHQALWTPRATAAAMLDNPGDAAFLRRALKV